MLTLKKLVAAFLVLCIVSSVPGLFLVQYAHADPANVKVLNYSWYVYPSYGQQGDVIVVGEVQNVGTTIIDHINLKADIFDATGAHQGLAYTTARIAYLEPGAKSPFYFDFYFQNSDTGFMDWVNNPGVGSVNFTTVYAGDTTEHAFSGAVVTESSASSASGVYTVTGTVKNTAAEKSPNLVYTVTTFYNASGTVVGVNMTGGTVKTQGLEPGDSFSFTTTPIAYWLINSTITSYSVAVQCEDRDIPVSTPTPSGSPSATSSPGTTPSPSGSAGPTQTPAIDNTWLPLDLVYVLVGVVAIVVIVGVGIFFWRRGR